MDLKQNDFEYLQNQIQQGKMTPDEANIEIIRMQRVLLVTGKIPAEVRKALNNAVKTGYLFHLKKDGNKPEVYFHPNFDYLAKQERYEHELKVLNSLKSVCT
ncbi:MAG: hypothetical protein PVI88_00010 [Nitrosopumilaceae archaeon]|jgi:hypothetical protein